MKIVRSILLVLIGIVSIVIGCNNLVGFYEVGDAYTYIDGRKHIEWSFEYPSNKSLSYIMILGGAALIVFSIPTSFNKKEKGGEQ